MELFQHGYPPSIFSPDFPRDLVFFLVGAPVLLSLGLWLSTAAVGLWTQRRERWLWAAIAVVGVVVAVLWWGLRPAFLYPRFFMFLIPGCAYLMAAAIARWRVLAPVVVAGAVVAAVAQVPTWTEDPLALPRAAAAVERVHATGGRALAVHTAEQVPAPSTNALRGRFPAAPIPPRADGA